MLSQILRLSHRSVLLNGIGDIILARRSLKVSGLAGSGKALLLSFLAEQMSCPILVVTREGEEGERLRDDLEGFLGAEKVRYFPSWGVLPYEAHSPHKDLIGMRLEALSDLASEEKVVVITTPRAVMTKVLSPEKLRTATVELKVGQTMDFEAFISRLVELGFERESMVTEMGQLSVRGGIVDLFSFGYQNPVRVEFYGDQVESIREFDVYTQRSVRHRQGIRVLPAREVLFNRIDGIRKRIREFGDFSEGVMEELVHLLEAEPIFDGVEHYAPLFQPEMVTLVDYLPPDALVFLDEPEVLQDEAEGFWVEVEEGHRRAKLQSRLALPPFSLYEPWGRLEVKLGRFPMLYHSLLQRPGVERVNLEMKAQGVFHGNMEILRGEIEHLRGEGYHTFILCDNRGQGERLEELLGPYLERVTIGVGGLHEGFVFPDARLAVFTDHEIFGRYRRRRRLQRFKTGVPLLDYESLKLGDYVVHVDHGIGQYLGPERILVEGQERDCLAIAYQGGDKLYVPVEQLGRIQKYTGQEAVPPTLSKLGGTAWEQTKTRAKQAIKEMARELLEIYATRKVMQGYAFSPDTEWQRELEASFIYEETSDQLQATAEIKKDMESPVPMDRLVCGDVGYGKTEVAIRVAFKAVMDGKQVAVLVPTTVLAQQHFHTFRERLAAYPVHIAILSRFKSRKEQQAIVEGLKRGTVDIVIGTHRLLQNDVWFHDLGLVIIDEEQRFGVAHKEKLKKLRRLVDVLTLTATPIPRTLYLSLMGARDMSIINTPPKDRLPIHTEIVRFDRELIAEAILREVDRGGQVYFVHNRVRSIEAVARFLKGLLPRVRFAIAHGQMPEWELERVMLDFLDRKYDCLVSTVIIESGLDMPNVNTIIINRADQFGLAQLYQLRGRVGRSDRRAYAYLLIPPLEVLSEEARKRLKVIEEFSYLGSGFQLALRDLEIRGAGNILGPEQHGFITAIGFDLYCRLLEEAVRELKGEEVTELPEPELSIRVDAYIPDEYIPDCEQKTWVYQRMARIQDLGELERMEEELKDRFGRIPKPTRSLLDIVAIKVLARRMGISSVAIQDSYLILEYPPGKKLSLEELRSLVNKVSAPLEFLSREGLGVRVRLAGSSQEEQVALAKLVLHGLALNG